MTTAQCAAQHFGPWLIYPDWFHQAVDAVKNGVLLPRAGDDPKPATYDEQNGVAIVRLEGPLMKMRSKFGGTSTVDARAALRAAVADPAVHAVVLLIDSPGGTMAGTEAMAHEVARADRVKPVYAHIQDLGASAAYYIASQARRITAEPTSLVGSLGVLMTLVDESGAADMRGLRVINISSGAMKGAGTPGTKITAEQVAYFQGLVDTATRHFKAAVQRGRGLTDTDLNALFDGRVHDAAVAQSLRLIDGVVYFDALIQEIHKMTHEQFIQYGTDHPDAAAEFIRRGHNAGYAEGVQAERSRVMAILQSLGCSDQTAISAIADGTEAEVVARVAAAILAERNRAEKLELRLAEAQRQLGQPAVAHVPAPAADVKPTDDPAAIAAWEWEHEKPKGFSTRERYINWRVAELKGQIRVVGRAGGAA